MDPPDQKGSGSNSTQNKEVKKQLKKDKNSWAEKVTKEAQNAAQQGHLKTVYDPTRKLSIKKGKTMDSLLAAPSGWMQGFRYYQDKSGI